MDHYPRNINRWLELEQAIDDVDSLPMEDDFIERMQENSIYEVFRFDQGPRAIWVDNTEFFKGSALTKHIESDYIVIEDAYFESTLRGDFTDSTGKVKINGKEWWIASEKGQSLLYDLTQSEMPPLPIEPSEVNNLLLAVASSFVREHLSTVAAITHVNENEESEPRRLGMTIFMSGSLFGSSSHTIRSLFQGDNDSIIAEFTETESPVDSGQVSQLLLGSTIDRDLYLTDEILLQNEKAIIDNAEQSSGSVRRASHDWVRQTPQDLIDAVLSDNPFERNHGIIAEYSDAENSIAKTEVQQYANLCEQFLKAYRKIN